MRADVSRIRSNPLFDFAGVELKQGGVLVDADFNEHVAIGDRRLRAAASDILGRGTVSSTTPDAFKITVPVAGDLSIGIGRLYVDGLLAENHGSPSTDAAKKRFDPLLGEVTWADAWTYATQPYLPSAPALPAAGRHLVYLDAWDREVTHLERPDLVEVALGVESSSRRQLVWQVRVLDADAGAATCASPDADVPAWSTLIAPSSGRLTTGTYDVPPAEDPCELPPTGGYRGLENQLYRIEIHEGGQPGPGGATFKWSRDSVGSRVANMISGTELELDSLGRDDVLRFNTGDWVEVIDDVREFAQACGEMRKITVDEDTRRITFATALPADLVPATFPSIDFPRDRNLRVRLWHQQGVVLQATGGGATSSFQDLDADDAGTIGVPATDATTLLLEHGITVKFAAPAGSKGFKAGDYWVFAARSADGSVELLDNAPPRGIHHHFSRLGVWDVLAGTVTDCRQPWPPKGGDDCVCTVCVSPEAHKAGTPSLQQAIDKVIAAGGGTICLDVGEYFLDTPLRVENIKPQASLRIVGKGVASVLRAPQSVFDAISDSHNVHLEQFSLITDSGPGDVRCLVIRNSVHVCLEHLDFTVGGQGPAVGLSGALADIAVRHCTFRANAGITNLDQTGAATGLMDVRIEDNDFDCLSLGVALTETSIHQSLTRITGNRINNCRAGCLKLAGETVPGFGVDVSENTFLALGDAIVSGVDGLRVTRNAIRAQLAANGIGVTLVEGLAGGPALSVCQISGNRISGFEMGIAILTALETTMLHRNQIDACVVGILAKGVPVRELSIDGNQITGMAESALLVATFVATDSPARISVRGNHVDAAGGQAVALVRCRGGDIVYADNHAHHPRVPNQPVVMLQAETLIVASNRVTGRSPDAMQLDVNPNACTVLGNITSGKIRLGGGALPNPWAPFNPVV